MDWKIDYLQKDKIVRVKMLNPINLEATKKLCIETTTLARKRKSHKYLIDHRNTDVILSESDINKIPDTFREAGVDFLSKTVILLDPSASASDRFELLKDVVSHVWMHFELFTDEQKALDWLRSL